MSEHIHSTGELLANRYEVLSFIGEGGMQEVYEAEDKVLSRKTALKVPKNLSAVRRFKQSAVLSARVNHPNAAKTLDYFEEGGRFYLVEELIVGTDLAKLRNRVPMMDPYTVAHVLHHLAKAVAALHHVDVVHRDLKPSNVMIAGGIDFQGIKVTDFGVAKMAEAELNEAIAGGEVTITHSSTAIGAAPYLAPEVIDNPTMAGKPADIWALGALAYELLSGTKPFGKGLKAIIAITSATPPPLPSWVSSKHQFRELGTDIHKIILQCLNKSPDMRPNADELVQLCEQLCYPKFQRHLGTINNYINDARSFGFIHLDDFTRVFFHSDSVYGATPPEGTLVWFARFTGKPRDRAHPVVALAK